MRSPCEPPALAAGLSDTSRGPTLARSAQLMNATVSSRPVLTSSERKWLERRAASWAHPAAPPGPFVDPAEGPPEGPRFQCGRARCGPNPPAALDNVAGFAGWHPLPLSRGDSSAAAEHLCIMRARMTQAMRVLSGGRTRARGTEEAIFQASRAI